MKSENLRNRDIKNDGAQRLPQVFNFQFSIFNFQFIAYKVVISIIFGLLGFAVNFYPVDFVFYGSYRMSFLFGLLFPMLITLSWGWKYGLLSALCGGCQTMWILWLPGGGYGACVSVPPFTMWIVWLGWFSRTRYNIYLGEILFRIFNTVLLYTVFRWAFTLNVPPASVGIPLAVVHSMVFKELANGLLLLFIVQAFLHLGRVRTFFKLPKSTEDPRLYYTYINSVILGGILVFGFVGEKYIWGMWGPEFQNVARILGSLLLLLIGITCTYFTANAFAKKKTEELVLAGQALRESEDDFKKLLEYSPVAIAILDKNENIEYANRKYAETIGYTDKINLSDWSILAYPDKDYRKWVIEKWNADVEKALREGKEIEPSEHNVTCKDGKVRVMEISGTFVTDKTIAIFTDITERKRAEEALAEREEKFRLIAENSIDCVWTLDTRLRFTYLSPSVKGIMGFTQAQWIGTKLSSHFKKKEFLKVGVLAAKSLKNYKGFTHVTFETKMINNKNEEVDLEISSKPLLNSNGKVIGLQGITRAIAERKKAEKILKDSKIKLQLLYDSSSDAIMLLDEKGFFDCNESTLRLFGCANKDEFCSMHPADFSPPTQPDGTDSMTYAKTNIAVALKKGSNRFEHLHRRLDGTDFPAEVLLDALMLEGKKVLQARVYDLTERKQVYEELAKYRDHLEELVRKRTAELNNRVSEVEQLNIEMVNLSGGLKTSNKSLEATTRQLTAANKELEAFAYSVSHDLRAPLRNIDGFSQILLEDYSGILDEQGQHYLQRVRAGTQNMGQLIDDILSLSRSGRHHMDKKTINMESIVREVYRSLKNELKDRKVDFTVHECPPALADSHLLKIVFTNLLSNALKFTRIRENAKIETGSMAEDGHTVFFIKDNGAGFDMNYADKLFIPFQRLHRAEEYEGSGIGLAIVQRIIHRHGGRIWAKSEIDVGTTFYFTFSV